MMIKSAFLALAASAATLAAGGAHAGGVSWSIGINTPVLGTVISNAPAYSPAYGAVYAPAPVYVPAPVRYAPVPAYPVAPPAAYYAAPVASVVYAAPAPVVYAAPVYAGYRVHHGYPGWRHGHRHGDGYGWR